MPYPDPILRGILCVGFPSLGVTSGDVVPPTADDVALHFDCATPHPLRSGRHPHEVTSGARRALAPSRAAAYSFLNGCFIYAFPLRGQSLARVSFTDQLATRDVPSLDGLDPLAEESVRAVPHWIALALPDPTTYKLTTSQSPP